ncbi:hypothetical protein BTO20_37730 (plasmid) [Mycobacterium dioxanotrophicus]|jgi:hypothetical protein|uniref:Uncharacterized protein n=1 Tax=Mycobacterium dioxanotrophicus TaxID=482462 RepID=A0A1Y0CGF1_9MYCO|nr:hypothetical protein [Mycobacterium dioxanotrophicus]ART74363.1 hypothetical protein BTO20_37730 [Mycobacterium dioxanotrophicus]
MAFTVYYPENESGTFTDDDTFAVSAGGVLKVTYTSKSMIGDPIRRTDYYSPSAWKKLTETPASNHQTPGTEGMYK